MIKSFEKLKVRIDQNLNRAEKSEALAEDVVKVENKVACLKQVRKPIFIFIFEKPISIITFQNSDFLEQI